MTEKRGLYQAYVEVTADPEQRVMLDGEPAIQLTLVMPTHARLGIVTGPSNLREALPALLAAHDAAIAASPAEKSVGRRDDPRCICCDWLSEHFDRVMADWW